MGSHQSDNALTANLVTFCEVALRADKPFRRLVLFTTTVNNVDWEAILEWSVTSKLSERLCLHLNH